jgi:cell division protein FtsA
MAAKIKVPTVVGLDIGTTNITVVVAETQPPGPQSTQSFQPRSSSSSYQTEGPYQAEGRVNVLGVGIAPSKGLRKGVVINIEATIDAIGRAVEQAETMSGVEISSVFAAISGNHIKGMNSNGIVAIKHKEVSQLDVDGVIRAAKAVAMPPDREILHVLPQEFLIDDQDGIREPIGISGVRLETRVHIVTGAVASAQNIVKCANRCGLSVKDISLASLASAKAVLSPEEQELGVAILDIGGGTTDIIVFHNGAVKHTSVLAVGGNHITNDIAAGLRTPWFAAEEIKCKHGTAHTSLVSGNETIEVPSTGDRAARVLSKLVLSEIIEPRVHEIITMAQRDLVRAGCDEILTSGLVITGGSANLNGIAQVAEQVFNLPVRVGAPRGVGGLIDLVKGPEYASAVGLVLIGSQQSRENRLSSGQSRLRSSWTRVRGWLGEHF